MPGRRGENHGADTHEKTNAMQRDESATDALEEGEEKAGPVEPPETRG